VPTPSPTLAPARKINNSSLSSPEKKKNSVIPHIEKKGGVGGKNIRCAEAVISAMNELAGRRWTSKAWEPTIAKLLGAGYTEEDLLTVVYWKAAESERQGDWQWFKPDTLFRPTLFAAKLDNARAGVVMTGPRAWTEGERRKQRHAQRAETQHEDRGGEDKIGYVDI
jgi:hypothetical protein